MKIVGKTNVAAVHFVNNKYDLFVLGISLWYLYYVSVSISQIYFRDMSFHTVRCKINKLVTHCLWYSLLKVTSLESLLLLIILVNLEVVRTDPGKPCQVWGCSNFKMISTHLSMHDAMFHSLHTKVKTTSCFKPARTRSPETYFSNIILKMGASVCNKLSYILFYCIVATVT